jgi:YHS domain-containing protein
MTPHHMRPARVVPRTSIALAALCAGFAWQPVHATDPEAIAWRDDYGKALEEARTAHRLLWIYFTGPWCPNCARMERDSFPHPAIVQHARQSFIPLALRSDLNPQLVERFNVTAVPTTIIVAPNRDIFAAIQGYLGPDELDAFLRDALARHALSSARDRSASNAEKGAAGAQRHTAEASDDALALAGFCVVSLVCDRKLVVGKAPYTVRHEGRTYRFASLEMSERFRKEPERYVPANDGCCPVTRVQQGIARPGDPKWGVLCAGRLFLCATEQDRRAFLDKPEPYAMVDLAEAGYCVHCIREFGILIPGDPQHEVARGGLRYWFPDSTHRDAFLASWN